MKVTFDVTRIGGHLGKVKFRVGRQTVEPFSTAPWCDQPEATKLIPLLRVLRGDFSMMQVGDGRRAFLIDRDCCWCRCN